MKVHVRWIELSWPTKSHLSFYSMSLLFFFLSFSFPFSRPLRVPQLGGSPNPLAAEPVKQEYLDAFNARKDEIQRKRSVKYQVTAPLSSGGSEAKDAYEEEVWRDSEPVDTSKSPNTFIDKAG